MIIFHAVASLLYIFLLLTFFLLATPFAFLTWIITAPFDRQRRVSHSFNALVGHVITGLNPYWRIKVHGRENLKKDEAYVLAPNHQSLLDIPVLAHLFPFPFKYVSKRELTFVPFLGWIMAMASYVLLNRKDPKSQIKMMKSCEHYLKNGMSIGIYPEGTRSKDGSLGRFKDGASLMAKISGVKIVPICMTGIKDAMPTKGIIWTRKTEINMYILPPIDPEEFKKTKEVTIALKDAIQKQLG